ncbi:PPE family protein [Mycobacterium hackensackense]|uniref:PPE family protein n=1 Tax=Mycobacterium hackensackense TaxID=228909 RepID=UPI002265A445|nr:PPE family protein [Mycobacterium hackensackense]MCV7256848.1 PPE family protein [Mycobacterium hackensackense]
MTEPWGGYIPEVNAGRQETGAGPATWLASATMWTDFAALVGEAMAVMTAELAALGINWQGLAPTAMGAAVVPFMTWLATMEANAAANALSCLAVAEAFAIATGTMIPTPVVNMNRISEAIAEATNFLGVNSGIILALNTQYGEFWGNNGGTMTTYDAAVQAATVPKPVTPPPPLANAAGALGQVGESAARSAAESAIGNGTDAAMQAAGQTGQGATQAGSTASEIPQSMMSSVGQFASAPGQLLQAANPSTLTQPLQSLMEPLQSLLGNMGGSTTDAAGFGMGPGAPSPFTGIAASAGAGAGGDAGGAGAGGGFVGGGLGGGMLGQTYMGASGGPVKSQQVFSGVSARPTIETVGSMGPSGSGGGGGMSPMMGHGAGAGSSSGTKSRSGDTIFATPDAAPTEERPA